MPIRPSPRGGRRPGAGAPRGNLNALKHGLRSRQFAQLGALLATVPETREALLGLARRHQLKQRRAEHVAALLFTRLLQHARDIAADHVSGLNAQSPIHERRTINRNASRTAPRESAAASAPEESPPHNQTADSPPAGQSDSRCAEAAD